MQIKISCLKDNWIQNLAGTTLNNYGFDNTLQIFKTTSATGRVLSKFDIVSLYTFMSQNNLTMAQINSCKLKYYDINEFKLLDQNYQSPNSFSNCDLEIKFLDKEFDEGIGSSNNTITGYSNYINAADGDAWTTSGGSVSSITSLSTITQSLTSSYQNIDVDIKTYINYLYSSYTSTSADLNKGFLIKLTSGFEGGSRELYKKELISKDVQISSFQPEIIINFSKIFKDETNSYVLGRDNIFGIINYDENFNETNITSITSVTLSAFATSSSTASTLISSSSNLSFNTIVKGYHTFSFNLPTSLSSNYSFFLTITYADSSGSKTITKMLTTNKLLTQTEYNNIISNQSRLYNNVNYFPIDTIDITNDFLRINILSNYSDFSNQMLNFNFFNNTQKIPKNLEYKLYDKNGKIIQDWEQCHYNDTNNFILIHNSLLNSNMKYFIDLRLNNLFFNKEIQFSV